ncbi:Autoinducer 2 sensor kinase/phosphatase LuxQ [BD1-7 clade bacterium]|uniref:histidine kinase n=1 Tax=BD1-7 clade bacterium TaxID=2029982 RepID=A0A5S9N8Y2_9GAMM|nr:Autoinducer 2 sensor kinase/phosphatase LuxQ [BD1-7 clade bacterium]CAA0085420.1 Autoinducer 2 sensor kinase/phosphatase LuxQ [BD1-7 clade bacterium]
MTLQRQVILFIIAATSVSVITLYWIVQHRINKDFTELEQANTLEDLRRFNAILDYDGTQLIALAHDWGQWDQSYQFIAGEYPGFEEDNISPATLETLGVELLAMINGGFDSQLAIVDGGPEIGERSLTTKEWLDLRRLLKYQRNMADDMPITELAKIGDTNYLVGSFPSTRNDGTGERYHGYVVFARAVNDGYLARVADMLKKPLVFTTPQEKNRQVWVDSLHIHGSINHNDFARQPLFAVELTNTRDIYAKAEALNRQLIYTLVALGLLIIVAAYWGLHFSVIRPLEALRSYMQRYSLSRQSDPVVISGASELADLASAFNHLMASIDSAQGHLNRALDDARKASRAKSQFLANMSHEIRTPMAAVMGYTELLRSGELTEAERLAYLEILESNGSQLLAIINDILDLSRIEAGELRLDKVPTDMAGLLYETLELLDDQAHKSGNTLNLRVSDGARINIMTDPVRVRQVLVNIIGNAIKFTDHGSIDIDASIVGNYWQVQVRDTGVGMDEYAQKHAFDSFYQFDSTDSRHYQGTGLGLTIARDLVQSLGGTINLVSSAGQGSCFKITLPADEPISAVALSALPGPQSSFSGRTAMVVDDNPVMSLLMTKLLENMGMSVSAFNNAVDALVYLDAPDCAVEIIFMDMQMPAMDGYEATRLIVSRNLAPRVIAVTASSMEGDEEACLAAGCSAYLSKPINTGKLVAILDRWLPTGTDS